MGFFDMTDFKVGNRYVVTTRPTKREQVFHEVPNVKRTLVGECIAVFPNNILLKTADCRDGQHYAIAYEGMTDMAYVPEPVTLPEPEELEDDEFDPYSGDPHAEQEADYWSMTL